MLFVSCNDTMMLKTVEIIAKFPSVSFLFFLALTSTVQNAVGTQSSILWLIQSFANAILTCKSEDATGSTCCKRCLLNTERSTP